MANSSDESDGILIVDGDVLVRHAIADYLRSCGYAVIEAASTDEAQIVVEQPTVAIAAVLCDAEAPGSVNAFELRNRAKRTRDGVPVILAGSVEGFAKKAAELCEQGPDLSRPYDPQGVVDYIRRVLGRSSASDARTG